MNLHDCSLVPKTSASANSAISAYAIVAITLSDGKKNNGKQMLSANEASGIRTPDNLIKSQVLYRLS